MSTYVRELKRKPKDMERFVSAKAAVEILRKVAAAIATADSDTLWHFSIRMRVSTPIKKEKRA